MKNFSEPFVELLLGDSVHATKELADPTLVQYYGQIENREIALFEEITSDVNKAIFWIRYWNAFDNYIKTPIEHRTPITLLIDSPGGDACAGMTLYHVLKASKTPVRAVCYANCMSIAVPIMLGATKGMRYALPSTSFLIHDGTFGVEGSMSKTQDTMAWAQALSDNYKSIILSNSNITEEQYETKRRIEWYMFAEEAKQLGLIDHIITDLSDIEVDPDD